MTQLVRSLHVALLVSDVEKADAFYNGVLGLEKVERSLNFPGTWYQLGDFQIHLMQCDHWQAPCPRPEKWGRNPHIAFQVNNLEEIRTRLEAHHYPVQLSASGRAALFTQDPDGNIIELSAPTF
jgi:catechol 2,3-dioxygenase-like lactoylglutathione lyase family enzyme